ncbi:MAG: B12-binding domain-containing radical SAM protein [Candidatus Omnitrophica bacterium]|nr:B12-binding domain-containing radical SAM protein [Candidatus Omnitrophota bacterium]
MIDRPIKKLMLIFPPVVFSPESVKQIMPPLGITYLAAYLRDDFQVKLLDAAVEGYAQETRLANGLLRYGLSFSQIKQQIIDFEPDAVSITCLYSSQISIVNRICRDIKSISENIVTIVGGSHPSFLAEKCLENQQLDFIILGEGEETLKNLLTAISNKADYAKIDGLAFRNNNIVQINPKTQWIENIDLIPFPARDLLPLEKYHKINLPMGLVSRQTPAMNLITSRGCPFECAFCSSCHFWGRKYRPRSVENVIQEMCQLKAMGIKEIKFFDDNLTLDKPRAKKLFQAMIDRKFNFTWNTPNGIAAQTLDPEMISLMKQSGCYEITLAVESGDPNILRDVLNKPTDLKQIEEISKIIKAHKINTYGFFIIGFPQETKAQIFKTLEFMNKLALDRVSLFIANPLPGTRIFEYCRQKGYLNDLDDTSLDYFQSKFETEEFDSRFLEKTRRNWYWTYNLKLFLRNPFKFFQNYNIFLFRKPMFFFRTIFHKLLIPILKS